MKNIIITGGIGNQMFQYALYCALKEKKTNSMLNVSLYSQVKMHNGYELKRCFNIDEPIVKSKFSAFRTRVSLKLNCKSKVYNDRIYFDKEVFYTKCKYLSGYWQSELYFNDIQEKIRNVFIFRNIDSENRKIAEEMRTCTSIGLHIRRGDYVNNTFYYDLSNDDYYYKAIEYINYRLRSFNDLTYYVFSDDSAYASEFLNSIGIRNTKIININRGQNSYKDMFLMSQCKHNIIANSSFSWWGAWLNSNPQKNVIAPRKWFKEYSEQEQQDLIPKQWIKL